MAAACNASLIKYQESNPSPTSSQETVDSIVTLGRKRSDSDESRQLDPSDVTDCHYISEPTDLKLKFGVKLERIFSPPDLHPRLQMLLHYIYVNGPFASECNFTDLSPVDVDDKHEVKNKLMSGRPLCISDYTLPAIVHVVRSFLKHLPQPLLHYSLFHTWVSTGEIIHQYCYLPSKRDLVIHAIQQNNKKINVYHPDDLLDGLSEELQHSQFYLTKSVRGLLTELNGHEELLLRHLFVSLRSLSQPNECKCPDLGRVHQVAHLFAPCLLRRRFDWPGSNPKTEAKVALMTFLIIQLHRIFGNSVKNLYPAEAKCSASCCNLALDTTASDMKSNEGRHFFHDLLETCLPFHGEVGNIGEVAGTEEVL